MPTARQSLRPETFGRVIDFDEGILETCAPGERGDLEAELAMLTSAFASADDPAALQRMARALNRTAGEARPERLRARRLAAMLRLRARTLRQA